MQIDRNNYGTMLFMSKQVSLPKISSILQKMKISQKFDIRPFCAKPFNYIIIINNNFIMHTLVNMLYICSQMISRIQLQNQ